MALTADGISRARSIMELFSKNVQQTNHLSLEIITYMTSNETFDKFTQGTEFGNETYEKWTNLIKLIENELNDSINSLIIATNNYLEVQERLNNKNY